MQTVLMAIIKKPMLKIMLSFINFVLTYWFTKITNTDKQVKILTISNDSFFYLHPFIFINLLSDQCYYDYYTWYHY